jgi:hypothetical protein
MPDILLIVLSLGLIILSILALIDGKFKLFFPFFSFGVMGAIWLIYYFSMPVPIEKTETFLLKTIEEGYTKKQIIIDGEGKVIDISEISGGRYFNEEKFLVERQTKKNFYMGVLSTGKDKYIYKMVEKK